MPHICGWSLKHKTISKNTEWKIDSTAVSIFVVILIESTNSVFVNSTNITTNIETAVLSNGKLIMKRPINILISVAKYHIGNLNAPPSD